MRRAAIFWGGLLILLGLILLLDNLGILSVNIWSLIFPIIIIGVGVWILWGSITRRSMKVEQVSVQMEGSTQAKVHIKHGAGRLSVVSGENNQISGECNGGVDISTQQDNGTLNVTMSVPDWITPWFGGWQGSSLDWALILPSGLPLFLAFDTGASDARLDLSDLLVREIRLNSGASSTKVKLPAAAGETLARFKTGAASLEIQIPPGVSTRIRTSGGLANITVDQKRFPRYQGIYQSLDYETAPNKVDIQVELGVGSVDIR